MSWRTSVTRGFYNTFYMHMIRSERIETWELSCSSEKCYLLLFCWTCLKIISMMMVFFVRRPCSSKWNFSHHLEVIGSLLSMARTEACLVIRGRNESDCFFLSPSIAIAIYSFIINHPFPALWAHMGTTASANFVFLEPFFHIKWIGGLMG